jgi:hypothetical protein
MRTRTGAENADLAIVIGLRAYPLHCGLGIADHLGVGNAAVDAHFGGDVVRMTASACTPALGPFLWDRDCF